MRTRRDWRAAGRRALLATVVRTCGSSSQPVDSIMALRDDGAVAGSVSGGCIEDDLIHRANEALPYCPPALVNYGLPADEAHRFGLPCGGTLELLLEPDLDPDPVGLHIGSRTPPEIAISAMAEILAVKNGKDISA